MIRYSYLWLREHRDGREEGAKDRPCAIILALPVQGGKTRTLVVPVTHSPPESDAAALELPQSVKEHLGLDRKRSWVVLSESNLFNWPGPDLRRIGDLDDSSVAYGFLPPRLFAELGFIFPQFPYIAHSRGWSHEDMERNVEIVRNSSELAEGAQMLAKRCLDLARHLLERDEAAATIERGGRKAHPVAPAGMGTMG